MGACTMFKYNQKYFISHYFLKKNSCIYVFVLFFCLFVCLFVLLYTLFLPLLLPPSLFFFFIFFFFLVLLLLVVCCCCCCWWCWWWCWCVVVYYGTRTCLFVRFSFHCNSAMHLHGSPWQVFFVEWVSCLCKFNYPLVNLLTEVSNE